MRAGHASVAPLALAACLLARSAAAEPAFVPATLVYEGQLLKDGLPVDELDLPAAFRLYDGPAAGDLLCEIGNAVSPLRVDVIGGRFSVPLNLAACVEDLSQARAWWLELTLRPGAAEEVLLAPRQSMSTVPYALRAVRARDADTVGGLEVDDLEESAEIIAAVADHAGIGNAHHTRYSDTEALIAVDGAGYTPGLHSLDTRCEEFNRCGRLYVDSDVNRYNVLDTRAAGGHGDPLYWGDDQVALGAHTADELSLDDMPCAPGQVVARATAASGWICRDPAPDPHTHALSDLEAAGCGPGAVIRRSAGGDAWECAANATAMVGEIRIWTGAVVPAGWLICDGASVSRTTYARLFEVIGTTFGAGDAPGEFNLPDTSSRLPPGLRDIVRY